MKEQMSLNPGAKEKKKKKTVGPAGKGISKTSLKHFFQVLTLSGCWLIT